MRRTGNRRARAWAHYFDAEDRSEESPGDPSLGVENMPEGYGHDVVRPSSGRDRMAALRKIAESGEPATVDGVMVEPRWAKIIGDLHSSLPESQQARLANTPISGMRDTIFDLVNGLA